VTASIPFTYGEPFKLFPWLRFSLQQNGAIDLANTVIITGTTLPAGATMTSSGMLHGTMTPSTYGLSLTIVPEPGRAALLLAGLVPVLLRRSRR
jgi:hypothetical protein